MADIDRLKKWYSAEEINELLFKAEKLARADATIGWGKIQDELKTGHEPAVIIIDWLADNHIIQVNVSEHWIRAGRTYVMNTIAPSLEEMVDAMEVGEQRGYAIMQELVKRKYIQVSTDFEFKVLKRQSSFKDLVRQMKAISKRYRGRCEPGLLMRTMYVDAITAYRLAQYGEETLGLYWKKKRPIFGLAHLMSQRHTP